MRLDSRTDKRLRIDRRGFLLAGSAALALSAFDRFAPAFAEPVRPIDLPPLPYGEDALSPVISANTVRFHYGKHHKGYVDNLNRMIKGTETAGVALEEIVKAAAGEAAKTGVFNNAAQAWNHAFYWKSLKPGGGGKPQGDLAKSLDAAFGSYDGFREEFSNTAVRLFGSGWGWLVLDAGKLKVVATGNADTPIARGQAPLLTVDVWEHAYYLDYQNRRADYVGAVIDRLLNWDFAAENFASAI